MRHALCSMPSEPFLRNEVSSLGENSLWIAIKVICLEISDVFFVVLREIMCSF